MRRVSQAATLCAALSGLALIVSGCGQATSQPAEQPIAPASSTSAEVESPSSPTPEPTPKQTASDKDLLRCYYGPNESDWVAVDAQQCPGAMSESPKKWDPSTQSPTPEESSTPPSPTFRSFEEPAEESQASNCTPGYDPCLPPASDYDCRGGSGNGPYYTGRVYVTGPDIYGLDRDGDGIGCE